MSKAKVKQAIEAIIKVCKQHNISIAHEDEHGGFIIENPVELNYDWLRDAHNNTGRRNYYGYKTTTGSQKTTRKA